MMGRLTKKSKILITVSSAISALLIATMILWYVSAGRNNAQPKGSAPVFLAIVLIAVISTAVVIYIRMRRKGYTKELSKEYFEAYEAVQDSVANSNLTISERKEVISDVAGMLYFAQKEGRALQDVVGEDTEEFVEKVKHSFGYRNGALFYFINGLMYLIMMLGLVQAVNFFAHEQAKTFFDAKMGISMFFYLAVLSFLVVPLVRRSMTKKKFGWTFVIPFIFVAIYIVLTETLHRIDIDAAWIDAYLNGEAGFITSWWWLTAFAALIGLGFIAKWLIRKRSIKKL